MIDLLTSKTVLGALAGVVIAVNQKYHWLEISSEDVTVLISVIAAFVVAALRRSNQKIEKQAEKAAETAENAGEVARSAVFQAARAAVSRVERGAG